MSNTASYTYKMYILDHNIKENKKGTGKLVRTYKLKISENMTQHVYHFVSISVNARSSKYTIYFTIIVYEWKKTKIIFLVRFLC